MRKDVVNKWKDEPLREKYKVSIYKTAIVLILKKKLFPKLGQNRSDKTWVQKYLLIGDLPTTIERFYTHQITNCIYNLLSIYSLF